MRTIREVLLTQYIGAMVVALLCCEALITVVSTVVRVGSLFMQYRNTLGPSSFPFPWDTIVFAVVAIALYLLAAYFLVRWLYPVPTKDK